MSFQLRIGDIIMARRGEFGCCGVVGPKEAGWLCSTGSLVRVSGLGDGEAGRAGWGEGGEAVERLQEYCTALITAAVTGKIDVRNTPSTR